MQSEEQLLQEISRLKSKLGGRLLVLDLVLNLYQPQYRGRAK